MLQRRAILDDGSLGKLGHWENFQVSFTTPRSAEIKNDKLNLLGLESKVEVL